jgi:sugar-specific transcriptional regulator TrmB
MEGIGTKEALEGAGLTNIEAKVYLELLELGTSTAGPIIKSLGLHRATVYSVLQRLIEKGLVSYIMRAGKRNFSATDPENILDDIKERGERIKGILPQLRARQKRSKEKKIATLYEGNKAVRSMFEEALNKQKQGEEQLVFGTQNINDYFNKFFKSYERRRANKGISLKIAINETDKEWINSSKNLHITEIKTIPKEFTSPAEFDILGNRTAIVLWGKNPLAVAIDSKEVSDSFRSYFNLLWIQETKVIRGLDAIQELFEEILETGSCDWIGAKGYFVDFRPKYIDEWERKAKKTGFKIRNIVDIETGGHRITKWPFAETKYTIPKEFSKLSVFWIYGNKVAITNWMGKEPIALVIENKRLHDMYKEQFELLWNQETTAYRGAENVKKVFSDVIISMKKDETSYAFTIGKISNEMRSFFHKFHKKRAKLGVRSKLIFCEDYKEEAEYRSKIPLTSCKLLPNSFASPVIVNIYGDVVLLNFWGTEKEPIAYKIKDKKISRLYKKQFDMLWKMAKK